MCNCILKRTGMRASTIQSASSRGETCAWLGDWIVEARIPVRFQMQLHKILWGEEQGR